MAAHLTEATDEEATMIARSGSSMCVCSGSIGIISLNLSPVLELPVRNIVPNLVYAAGGSEVRLAIVDGRELVSDGWVLTADEAAIRAEAQIQAKLVANRVAADPVHRDMALLAAMRTGQL
jgi:5-methylthioadenosine/S-adenosylhomocysteine deaminase